MTDPRDEREALADLTDGDEWDVGFLDGLNDRKPRPLVLADPSRAKAYREGYLIGCRERLAKALGVDGGRIVRE